MREPGTCPAGRSGMAGEHRKVPRAPDRRPGASQGGQSTELQSCQDAGFGGLRTGKLCPYLEVLCLPPPGPPKERSCTLLGGTYPRCVWDPKSRCHRPLTQSAGRGSRAAGRLPLWGLFPLLVAGDGLTSGRRRGLASRRRSAVAHGHTADSSLPEVTNRALGHGFHGRVWDGPSPSAWGAVSGSSSGIGASVRVGRLSVGPGAIAVTVAGTSPPRHGVWRWQGPLRQGPAECLPEPGGHVAVPPRLCAESASSFARNNAFQRTTLRDYLSTCGPSLGTGVIMSPGDAWQCLETFVAVSTGGVLLPSTVHRMAARPQRTTELRLGRPWSGLNPAD